MKFNIQTNHAFLILIPTIVVSFTGVGILFLNFGIGIDFRTQRSKK